MTSFLFVGVNGYVTALEKKSGKIVWTATLKGVGYKPVSIQPVPVQKVLLVAAGPNLRCISAETGTQIWENPLKGIGLGHSTLRLVGPPTRSSVDNTTQPPLHEPSSLPNAGAAGSSEKKCDAEDLVFVSCNSEIRALRLSDGADLWVMKPPSVRQFLSALPSLLIEDECLFVAGYGRVHALDPTTGQLIWMTDIKHRQYCTLSTYRSCPLSEPPGSNQNSNLLFVGCNGRLLSTPKASGNPESIQPLQPTKDAFKPTFDLIQPIPIANTNTMFLAVGGKLKLVSANAMLWENALPGLGPGPFMPRLALLNVLVGKNAAAAVDSIARQPSTFLPPYEVSGATPQQVPAEDTSSGFQEPVAIIAVNGRCRAIRVADGKDIWSYELGLFKKIRLPYLICEESKVFMLGDGFVVCLELLTGKEIYKKESVLRYGHVFAATLGHGNGETNRTSHFATVLSVVLDEEEAQRESSKN